MGMECAPGYVEQLDLYQFSILNPLLADKLAILLNDISKVDNVSDATRALGDLWLSEIKVDETDNAYLTDIFLGWNEFSEEDLNKLLPIATTYVQLLEEFKKETGGLEFVVYYIDEEEALRGSDVTGLGIDVVKGVYQRTPAGEKYKNAIRRSFFVV